MCKSAVATKVCKLFHVCEDGDWLIILAVFFVIHMRTNIFIWKSWYTLNATYSIENLNHSTLAIQLENSAQHRYCVYIYKITYIYSEDKKLSSFIWCLIVYIYFIWMLYFARSFYRVYLAQTPFCFTHHVVVKHISVDWPLVSCHTMRVCVYKLLYSICDLQGTIYQQRLATQ